MDKECRMWLRELVQSGTLNLDELNLGDRRDQQAKYLRDLIERFFSYTFHLLENFEVFRHIDKLKRNIDGKLAIMCEYIDEKVSGDVALRTKFTKKAKHAREFMRNMSMDVEFDVAYKQYRRSVKKAELQWKYA